MAFSDFVYDTGAPRLDALRSKWADFKWGERHPPRWEVPGDEAFDAGFVTGVQAVLDWMLEDRGNFPDVRDEVDAARREFLPDGAFDEPTRSSSETGENNG